MSHFVKKNNLPDTVVGEAGSAKRNIIRKGGNSRYRKADTPGQLIDDGSLSEDPIAMNEYDPNYDSQEETGREYIPTRAALYRENIAKSSITLSKYKKAVEPIIAEFFVSGDIDEVANCLQDIGAPEYSYEFVKRLVNASCDKGDRERESVSRLLSELYPDILSSNMIGKGFERLFELIDEVEKDCPAARHILSTYLARAVLDEVLPPSFLADAVVCNLGGEVVDNAKLMLSRDHAGAKLEKSWGPGDGRPVEEMKVTVDQLLVEYLLSEDLNEARRCIVELNAPLFFHEIVKRAVTNSMDEPPEKQACMSLLLHTLHKEELLSTQQAMKGFNRLYQIVGDLALDTPSAPKILDEFMERAKAAAVLPANYSPQKLE